MALERRDNEGGAVDTTITATIVGTDLSISIASATGWPSGGANGPFFVIVDYDLAGKEKIEVASRTGTTLTVASVGKRGVDGTSASTHQSGAKIRHCFTAQDGDEANRTMAETIGRLTTKGDLTPATGANATTRLAAGANNTVLIADSTQASGLRWGTLTSASLGTDSVGSAQIAADAVGTSEIAADSVGTSEIAPLAVTAAEIAADTITAAQIAPNSVGSSELADGSIDSLALFGGTPALAPFIVAAADPGAVGANVLWLNTTKNTLLRRNPGNTAWEVISHFGAHIDYTPVLTNITLGTGGFNKARYTRMGRTVLINGRVVLGTGGDVTGIIAVGLPPTALAADLSGSYAQVMTGHVGARARILGGGQGYAAVGVVQHDPGNTDEWSFAATAGYAAWDSITPVNWVPTDSFSWFAEYEAASAEDANFV